MEHVDKATQHQLIRAYLELYGSITQADAFLHLGITKLSTRISEMIRAGEPIRKEKETAVNRYGRKVSYRRYYAGDDE